MPVKHHYQSARADSTDPGAVQPSHWDADHDLTGILAALDVVAATPNVVLTLDGAATAKLVPVTNFSITDSPAFTGVPTAPTPAQAVNSTQIATTEYVRTAISILTGGAPGALDTLKELADAINDDASYAATISAALGVRLRVDAAQGLNSTQQTQGRSNLGLASVAASGAYSDLAGKPTLGTAAALNAGASANNLVQLDGSGKVPALDGSQLTRLLVALAASDPAFVAMTAIGHINAIRARAIVFMQMPNGLTDGYQTADGIDAGHSSNYQFDSRKIAVPTRSNAASVGSDSFDSLTSWTTANTGSGATTIVASGSSDPAIGNVLNLATGATASSVASVSKVWGSIPSSFGVMFISNLLTVGTAGSDGLVIQFENIDNVALRVRLNDDWIYLYQDGAYQPLFAVSGSSGNWREHWFNVTKIDASHWKVDLLLGTEVVASRTGALPAGTGSNGKVSITQAFAASNNRVSQVAIMQVGSTQSPDNMSLVGVDRTLPGGMSRVLVVALIEYVAGESIVLNTDIILQVAPNGHGTYEPVTLIDGGRSLIGIVDNTKYVHVVYGVHAFTGTVGTVYKTLVNSANGKYIAVHGLHFEAF